MLSPVVKAVLEESELSNDDVDALLSSKKILQLLKVSLFIDSNEVYFSLCSLITFTKNSSSPCKKVRKSARADLFGKIAYETFPIKNHGNIKLSHIEVATGLQSLSERWSRYSFDELLSLVFILDVNCKGTLSSEDFEEFTEMVDDAISANPAGHMTALTQLYDKLRNKLFLGANISDFNDQSVNSCLRRKLLVIANQARYLQQTPLTALEVMLEECRHNCSSELLVEFVENLAAFVKQHISDHLILSAENSVTGSRRSISSSRRASIEASNVVSDESVVESNITRLLDERDSNYSPEAVDHEEQQEESISFTLDDPNSSKENNDTTHSTHTTADSDNEGDEMMETRTVVDISSPPIVKEKESEALFVPIKESSQPSSTSNSPAVSASDMINPLSPQSREVDSLLTAPHSDSSQTAAINTVTPETKQNLLNSLNTFRLQALAISSSLERHEEQLVASSHVWSDLQAMETELRRAQELYRLGLQQQQVVNGENGGGTDVDVEITRSSRVSDMVVTEHQNVTSANTSSRTGSRSTSPSSSSRFFSQTPSSSVTKGVVSLEDLLAAQRPGSVTPRVVETKIPVSIPIKQQQSQQQVEQQTSTEVLQTPIKTSQQTSSSSTKKKITTTPQSARLFQEPPARINMNIFKSPIKRQAHGNVNKYNREHVGWQRTKPLGNSYNERFQTTADIRIANKTNAVFYGVN